ncbi:pentapeptide repeat-containing protein [Amycolatopsis alba]|uniref:pentapeptide repeat-containing protein n=1 Tax=Amycolatopsis alba TaxID=76020 RepID=UPI003CC8BE4E
MSFGGATFTRGATFTAATFTGAASFNQTVISRTMRFNQAAFVGGIPVINPRLARGSSSQMSSSPRLRQARVATSASSLIAPGNVQRRTAEPCAMQCADSAAEMPRLAVCTSRCLVPDGCPRPRRHPDDC